jgi:hypothetical protein
MDPVERTELARTYMEAINQVAKEVVSMAGRLAQEGNLDAQTVLEGIDARLSYINRPDGEPSLDDTVAYLDASVELIKEAFVQAAKIAERQDLSLSTILDGVGTHVYWAAQTPRMYVDDDEYHDDAEDD